MKKLLTILVVLALVIATFIPAFNSASAEGTSYGNADVDVLIERGIIQGFPDGALHLEKALTRAEFAKMLVKAFPYDYIPWFGLSKYSYIDTGKTSGHLLTLKLFQEQEF